MSKRFIFQQNGERKKAKLDISISDHNFPLSQNAGSSKESIQADTWGDEQDDEILLLASQACEEAYNDTSLPDYSICMQPMRTSTQIFDPGPSTSFKKPTSIPSNVISTNLKDKCNRISSPLPGISSKLLTNNKIDISDNFNDKIYKGQDSEYIYRQLLQLQEENTKLKSENGKLLEKCVTKEGEASILRTQLKTCQTAVDKARMEKIQAQEKVQIEWTEKLTAANNQMHDLRTQLDFKNLEIISIKEKCKMLESNKVKLTQVTVPSHDISSSQKMNSSYSAKPTGSQRRVKLTTSSAQTEDKAHSIILNKAYRTDQSKLSHILPLVVQPTSEQHPIIEYNEKLQTQTNQNKCRVYSTFHRAPNTPVQKENIKEVRKININTVYEDLVCVCESRNIEKCFNIFNTIQTVLSDVIGDLEQISSKLTTAFQKEMDERYIEATTSFVTVGELELLGGRCIFKEEQAILARRLLSILSAILQTYDYNIFSSFQEKLTKRRKRTIIDNISRICSLLDTTSCAQLYSGLLLSILYLLEIIQRNESCHVKIIDILKTIIVSRPMPFVACHMATLVRKFSSHGNFLTHFCPKTNIGNLKVDYDQGVLLYKKDSCYLQILLKQVECALKCIEAQHLVNEATEITRQLILLHSNIDKSRTEQKSRCDCQLILTQIIVYALRICAVMLRAFRDENYCKTETNSKLLPTCRSGIQVLYQCVLKDVEFSIQLSHNEGHLVEFCEIMKEFDHNEAYGNMLTELSGTFHSSPEEMTSSFHKQAWLNSFQTFSIAD